MELDNSTQDITSAIADRLLDTEWQTQAVV